MEKNKISFEIAKWSFIAAYTGIIIGNVSTALIKNNHSKSNNYYVPSETNYEVANEVSSEENKEEMPLIKELTYSEAFTKLSDQEKYDLITEYNELLSYPGKGLFALYSVINQDLDYINEYRDIYNRSYELFLKIYDPSYVYSLINENIKDNNFLRSYSQSFYKYSDNVYVILDIGTVTIVDFENHFVIKAHPSLKETYEMSTTSTNGYNECYINNSNWFILANDGILNYYRKSLDTITDITSDYEKNQKNLSLKKGN